MVEGIPFDD